MAPRKKKEEETPVFSFDGAVALKSAPATTKSVSKQPSVDVPKEHVQGIKNYFEAKRLESEAKALKESDAVVNFNAFAYDTWLNRGVKGDFASSLRFTSAFGDVLYIGTKAWKKINNEDDADFLREKVGSENFDQMVDTKVTLTGDLAEVQEKFNALVQSGKIDPKTARTVFEFLVSTFKKETSYQFKKDVLDWRDLFGMAGGDRETAQKVLGVTLSKRPYFKEG